MVERWVRVCPPLSWQLQALRVGVFRLCTSQLDLSGQRAQVCECARQPAAHRTAVHNSASAGPRGPASLQAGPVEMSGAAGRIVQPRAGPACIRVWLFFACAGQQWAAVLSVQQSSGCSRSSRQQGTESLPGARVRGGEHTSACSGSQDGVAQWSQDGTEHGGITRCGTNSKRSAACADCTCCCDAEHEVRHSLPLCVTAFSSSAALLRGPNPQATII